jgi:g-D-glutamyl-meso-diaminopimelate peptidase
MEVFNSNFAYDSQQLDVAITNLKRTYPFISVRSIGCSVLGKPIHEIKIGKGTKKIHMNASFHANEWITTMILMRLISTYLFSFKAGFPIRGFDTKDLFRNIELSVVPMVNPDGVDLVLNGPPPKYREEIIKINQNSNDFIHWKANIRGVDLNKQFPANWGTALESAVPQEPSSRDFPGNAPLTEPEAIAMANLVKNNDFDLILAFHTQGEEFYWGYEGFEPPESAVMAMELERASGYKGIQYIGSHGGYKDWFIKEFRRPGFTIELGKGINPLPLSQFNKILKRAEGLFLTALCL